MNEICVTLFGPLAAMCYYIGERVAWRYQLVAQEAARAFISVLSGIVLGTVGLLWSVKRIDVPYILLFSIMLACSVTDVRYGYIFDVMTIPALILLMLLAFCCGSAAQAAVGVLLTGGILYVMHVLFRGRVLGFGDVKLGAVIGAAMGLASLNALEAAFVCGGSYAFCRLLSEKTTAKERIVPFAPHLTVGACVSALLTTQ